MSVSYWHPPKTTITASTKKKEGSLTFRCPSFCKVKLSEFPVLGLYKLIRIGLMTDSNVDFFTSPGIFTVSGIFDSFVYHSQRAIKKKMEIGKFSWLSNLVTFLFLKVKPPFSWVLDLSGATWISKSDVESVGGIGLGFALCYIISRPCILHGWMSCGSQIQSFYSCCLCNLNSTGGYLLLEEHLWVIIHIVTLMQDHREQCGCWYSTSRNLSWLKDLYCFVILIPVPRCRRLSSLVLLCESHISV